MNGAAVFLSWHDSRRSRSLAGQAGLPFITFVTTRAGWSRHVLGAVQTSAWLLRNPVSVVWFQYSLALAVVLGLYRVLRIRRPIHLVADVHTKALRRDGGWPGRLLIMPLKRWTLRGCAAVIVTNEVNRDYASTQLGVRPTVLPDPLPTPAVSADVALRLPDRSKRIVFVCSFAVDEPLALIAAVARELQGDALCTITGDSAKLSREDLTRLSPVAELTGYVADDEYWRLLAGAGAVAVLTTEPACLPCGAYEAIALGHRPVLLEDAQARSLFGSLAVFANPDPASLGRALRLAMGPAGRVDEARRAEYGERWRAWWNEVVADVPLARRSCAQLTDR